MQRRSFELQLASQAEEEQGDPIDLAAVRAPTLVVVGEFDKPDFHEIAERLVRESPRRRRRWSRTPGTSRHWSARSRPLSLYASSSSASLGPDASAHARSQPSPAALRRRLGALIHSAIS
jgi:hypothetical protein